MGVQNLQISHVKKFIDDKIENDMRREEIKQSLAVLQDALESQDLTLKEVI